MNDNSKPIYHIVNGPNLNLLGIRETSIYGNRPFEGYLSDLRTKYPELEILYYQSNHEGLLIDYLQKIGFSSSGIILNAGGYTHTSIAMGDTIKAITSPVVEVHISDLSTREPFRQISYLTAGCIDCVMGQGLDGYEMSLKILLNKNSL